MPKRPDLLLCYKIKREYLSLSCKSHRFKTANIKIYPQILGTEARFYIYDPPMTDINAIAKVWRSGVEFAIKFLSLLF